MTQVVVEDACAVRIELVQIRTRMGHDAVHFGALGTASINIGQVVNVGFIFARRVQQERAVGIQKIMIAVQKLL